MRFARYTNEAELFFDAEANACTGILLARHLFIDTSCPYWLMCQGTTIEALGDGVVCGLTGPEEREWAVQGEDADEPACHNLGKDKPGLTTIQERYRNTRWHKTVSALTNNEAVLADMGATERKNVRKNAKRRFLILGDHLVQFTLRRKARPKSLCGMLREAFGKNRICVPREEMLALAIADEREHHDGRHRMMARLQADYVPDGGGRGWRDVITTARSTCPICDQWVHEQARVTEVICTTRPMELVMFDVTTMPMQSPCPNGRDVYKHLLVACDHFTKYTWIAALRNKLAKTIAAKLKRIFQHEGSPERWHSDNGGELDNHLVDAVQELLHIAFHSFGLPRNPRCQGLVERCNATVKRSLIKKCQDNGYTQAGENFKWHRYLDEVTAHENSNVTRLYGIAPFVCLRKRPFSSSGVTRELTPLDVSIMYTKMASLQRASRDRIAHRGHKEYVIGERVRVKAGQSLKRANAIALYSATGVVHSYSPSGTSFVRLLWETPGLSGESPGELSKRMYFIGRLRKVCVDAAHV